VRGFTSAANKIAEKAIEELEEWKNIDENSPEGINKLKKYWANVGQAYISPDIAWSGAFIYWVVSKGFSPDAIAKSAAHSIYAALGYNKVNHGEYITLPPTTSVEIGDIVITSRDEAPRSFEDIKPPVTFFPAHGDIVVGIDYINKNVRVVGGNKRDKVAEDIVPLGPGYTYPGAIAIMRIL
jgi:hypothetical protein